MSSYFDNRYKQNLDELYETAKERNELRDRVKLLEQQLAAAQLVVEKYRFLLDMFRHYKWSDIDAIHELQPDGEKYITVESIDTALTSVITAAKEGK